MLEVRVHDDGEGVPDAIKATIFQPFLRGQKRDGGCGLGLGSVATESALLDGTCGHGQSKQLDGAMFFFKVPYKPYTPLSEESESSVLRKKKKAVALKQAVAPQALERAPRKGKPLRILVVDDCEIIRRMTRRALQRHPLLTCCTIEEAVNGREGLKKMKIERYDVCLSDIQMPLIDGYQMLHDLRTWEQLENKGRQPVIFMSANSTNADLDSIRCVQVDGFIAKPTPPHVLVEELLRVVAANELVQPETSESDHCHSDRKHEASSVACQSP
jgi:CheY-like chemotaxis protein